MSAVNARYREYLPSPPLRASVRAFFTFTAGASRGDDPLWSNLIADAHASLICCLGGTYSIEGLWRPSRPHPHIIGPMTQAHRTRPEQPFTQIGAYFTATGARDVLQLPLSEITGRVVAFEDLCSPAAHDLEARMQECESDPERIRALEAALLRQLNATRKNRAGIDFVALATSAQQRAGAWSVTALSKAAGVSRQYLSRTFQNQLGVPPNLFLRLTRFRRILAATAGNRPNWAALAAEAGYSDQSHMIADFRRFSGSTPVQLSRANKFHPFRATACELTRNPI